MRLQSRAKNASCGAIWEAFLSIELLIGHILNTKAQYEVDVNAEIPAPEDDETTRARKHIKTSLDNCHAKLDKCYQLMDQSPVYAASVILNPSFKWRYFDTQWIQPHQRPWLTPTKDFVKHMWEEGYQSQSKAVDQPRHLPFLQGSPPSPRRHHEPDPLAQFVAPPGFYDQQDVVAARDEYDEYCRIAPKPCEYPLQWWKDHREEYPLLSKMARSSFHPSNVC